MILDGGRLVASVDLRSDRDVARARRRVFDAMAELGARPSLQTRFVTAVSEIARNAVVHGGGGTLRVYSLPTRKRVGIECVDDGPGIASLDQALADGFSTRESMGRGLGGAKRLADQFEVVSGKTGGTVVRMTGKTDPRP